MTSPVASKSNVSSSNAKGSEPHIEQAALCLLSALRYHEPLQRPLSKFEISIWFALDNTWYKRFIVVVIVLLCSCALWEPSHVGASFDHEGNFVYVLAVSMSSCIFLWIDLGLRWLVLGRAAFVQSKRFKFGIAILFLLSIDIILMVAGLPQVFRCLRPLMLFVHVGQLRSIIGASLQSLPGIFDALFFCSFLILLFGTLGVALYSPYYKDDRGLRTFPTAFLSLFVLLTTENWPEILVPVLNESPTSVIFFITFMILGPFILMNSLLAAVYQAYKNAIRIQTTESVKREWKSVCAAFKFLDHDRDGHVTYSEYKAVLRILRPELSRDAIKFFFHISDDNKNGLLDILDFLPITDILRLNVVVTKSKRSRKFRLQRVQSNTFWTTLFFKFDTLLASCLSHVSCCIDRQALRRLVESRLFNAVVVLAIGTNLAVLIVSSTTTNESWIIVWAIVDLCFLAFFVVEIALRIIAGGSKSYFSNTWNAVDFFLVAASLCTALIVLAASSQETSSTSAFSSLRLYRVSRIARIIPVLRTLRSVRAFASSDRLRVLSRVYLQIIVLAFRLSGVLVVLMYVYSIIGLEIFQNSFGTSINQVANFSSFPYAMLATFQLVTGSNFHEVMYDGMAATNGLVALYFCSFYFLVVIVLTNLLLSMFIDLVSIFAEKANDNVRILYREDDNVAATVEPSVLTINRKRRWLEELMAEDMSTLRKEGITHIRRETDAFNHYTRQDKLDRLTSSSNAVIGKEEGSEKVSEDRGIAFSHVYELLDRFGTRQEVMFKHRRGASGVEKTSNVVESEGSNTPEDMVVRPDTALAHDVPNEMDRLRGFIVETMLQAHDHERAASPAAKKNAPRMTRAKLPTYIVVDVDEEGSSPDDDPDYEASSDSSVSSRSSQDEEIGQLSMRTRKGRPVKSKEPKASHHKRLVRANAQNDLNIGNATDSRAPVTETSVKIEYADSKIEVGTTNADTVAVPMTKPDADVNDVPAAAASLVIENGTEGNGPVNPKKRMQKRGSSVTFEEPERRQLRKSVRSSLARAQPIRASEDLNVGQADKAVEMGIMDEDKSHVRHASSAHRFSHEDLKTNDVDAASDNDSDYRGSNSENKSSAPERKRVTRSRRHRK